MNIIIYIALSNEILFSNVRPNRKIDEWFFSTGSFCVLGMDHLEMYHREMRTRV